MPPRGAAGGRTALLVQQASSKAPGDLLSEVPPDLVRFSLQRADQSVPTSVEVRNYTAASLPQEQHEWAFRLVRDALKELYKPVWGWKDESKQEQLRAPTSRFLVAWATTPAPGADATAQVLQQAEQQQGDDTLQPRDAAGPVPGSAAAAPQVSDRGAAAASAPSSSDAAPQAPGSTQGDGLSGAAGPIQVPTTHTASPSPPPPAQQPEGSAPAALQGASGGAAAAGAALPSAPASTTATAAAPAVTTTAVPIAYINYRFEEGYAKDPVLYVYEMMVEEGWQRLGLASRLMQLAEHLAWENVMDHVVLTVISSNLAAQGLYKRLAYKLDKNSPDASKGYVIMSKQRPQAGKSGGGGGGAGASGKGKKKR